MLISQLVIFNVGVIFFQSDRNSIEHFPQKDRKVENPQTKWNKNKNNYDNENNFPTPDAYFNNYPIYFRKDQRDIETISHCVGENYQAESSWQKKSCEFTHLFCFCMAKKDFVVFEKPENEKMYEHAESHPFIDISQSYLKKSLTKMNNVSLGGINLKWSEGISRLEWFPEIRSLNQSLSYYELPSSVVMVPFHSMNGANPGHLVWDDFLPIYTLLSMFQLKNKPMDLMLMRYVLKDQDDSRGLWASCDWNDKKKEDCEKMFKKFLPLMLGLEPVHDKLITTEKYDFQLINEKNAKSTLVCAQHGLAGIGALTDHGTSKLHGWEDKDYQTTQNHGRGGMIYDFRNFMLKNMKIPIEFKQKPSFRIIFSERSSNIARRNLDFSKQKELQNQILT